MSVISVINFSLKQLNVKSISVHSDKSSADQKMNINKTTPVSRMVNGVKVTLNFPLWPVEAVAQRVSLHPFACY